MLKEIKGNLWDFWEDDHYVVITTNGDVRADGKAVMGRGCAREAAERIPELPLILGDLLQMHGNQVYNIEGHRIITFPVKHHWHERACLQLIEKSWRAFLKRTVQPDKGEGFISEDGYGNPVYIPDNLIVMPRPGCGNGGLDWHAQVKPLLLPRAPNNVWFISPLEED